MDSAAQLIARFEGCRLNAYQDQKGVWTCGFGCTGPDIGPHTVWTQAQAASELQKRVARIQHVLAAMLDVPVNQNQLDAITSLCYNIGLAAFEHSTLRRILNMGDYGAAGQHFLQWDHIDGVVNQGLDNRRRAELALFLRPIRESIDA